MSERNNETAVRTRMNESQRGRTEGFECKEREKR